MLAQLIRVTLAFALAFAPAAANAVCAFDGLPPATGTTFSPAVTTRTVTFTTAQPNDLIVFPVSAAAETNITYSFPNVISIVCTSGCSSPPTFTRRFQHQAAVSGCYSGPSTCYVDTEEWTASAPTPLSSVTLTVTMHMDLGYASLKPFGIHGTSGPDPNGSLTQSQTDLSGATTTIEVSSISTTDAPDLLVFSCDTAVATAPFGCQPTAAAGWNTINQVAQQNIFIAFGLNSKMLSKPLAAPVSGITAQPLTSASPLWFAWADAFVCTASGAIPQVQILD